jgi:Gram-negative bacterial TonB protein C-terminal
MHSNSPWLPFSLMRPLLWLLALFCICVAGWLIARSNPGASSSAHRGAAGTPYCAAMTNEAALRHFTDIATEPIYPSDAMQRGVSGIVVAEVCVSTEGGRPKSHVLFASDESFGRATASALRSWRFHAMHTASERVDTKEVGGKIVYYFLNEQHRGVVRRSTDSFYIGPLFTQEPRPADTASALAKGSSYGMLIKSTAGDKQL